MLRSLSSARSVVPRIFSARPLAPTRAFSAEQEDNVEETKLNRATIQTLTGVPQEHLMRRVWIHKGAKHAMSSGTGNTKKWRLTFHHGEKWRNPLMGWTSTEDPMIAVKLKFDTADEAIAYCKRNGYEYEVDEEDLHAGEEKDKDYSRNFAWQSPKSMDPFE
eukprot:TRINITY_DN3730_c0_g1_i2.p2 TRINITY_DN3730_c0_g1~~TRINITY_DN3730_c0_g1_i2.p2  ORF type:complete len:173 (-),score=49.57 TRINITY_DN3730_c0_g1_i2:205-690(-)